MNSITEHHVYILTREKREKIHNLIFKEKKLNPPSPSKYLL